MTDTTSSLLILAQDVAEQAKPGTDWFTIGKIVLVLFVVFVLPILLGRLIARMLKLKDVATRIAVVLFTLFLGMMPFAFQVLHGKSWLSAIKLGIDLAGGTNLVYQIDSEQAKADGKEVNKELIGRMVGAISRRLDPAAQEQITVRGVGKDQIEVIIPGRDPEVVAQKKKDMTRLGKLEFAILANTRRHQSIIDQAMASPDRDVRQGDVVVAGWRQVATSAEGKLKDVTPRQGIEVSRRAQHGGKEVTELLVILDPPDRRVTGRYLTKAAPSNDSNGRPAVSFTFNTKGGNLFASLTGDYQPTTDDFKHRLAILLDDQIQSAPQLNDVISNQGQITGDFTTAEVDELVNVLNAGALEAPIFPNPVSEQTMSPTLGADVQQKGKISIALSALAVVGFMLVYYRFSGIVADLSVILNIVMLMGAMSMIDASFTLPGLAGIVLTIGIAVDANVLIYERMREEIAHGSSLRMTIHNGFHKALSTIVDSHVTSLLTSIVLYFIGTDQIRGFAVSLFIGVLMSLFTALYLGRLLFDIFERKRWLKHLKMMSVIGKTNWDFVGKRYLCLTVSIVLIVVGMAAFAYRGVRNFDIDFTGGTMVSFQFDKDQEIGDVRSLLQQQFAGQSITVELLSVPGAEARGTMGELFRLRTTEPEFDKVKQKVNDAFTDANHPLRKVTMTYGDVTPVVAAKKPETKPAGENAETPVVEESEGDTQRFVGGNQTEFTFSGTAGKSNSGEVHLLTAQNNFLTELAKIKSDDGSPKYPDADRLFRFEGVAGSGLTAPEGQVRTYSKVLAQAMPRVHVEDFKTAAANMKTTMASSPTFEEINTFASSVAGDMKKTAGMALFFSFLTIVGYLWYRFQSAAFGIAAVVALIHDVFVVLGLLALCSFIGQTAIGRLFLLEDFKINLEMIAALLTLVGYSVHDTIVLFDRVREVRGKNPAVTEEMVNNSCNQTLSRTILTSFVTWLVCAVLYATGGEGLHGFAFCLVTGIVVGTYSSIYIACPVMLWIMNRPGSETAIATAAANRQKAAAAAAR